MVDHKGEPVDGDELIYIIACSRIAAGKKIGGVVGTQMSNLGMELAIKELGLPFARSKVGDRYVLEMLNAKGWALGGESSGHIMSQEEMDAVVGAADRVGAWLLADEVYIGTERTGDEPTPSFWGRYDRVLATGSMSKTYGMPGLRIGWIVTTEELVDEIWARQEYVTIGSAMLDNKLAAYALSPEVRPRVLQRTRDYVRNGYEHFERWARGHSDLLTWVPPQAAPVAFVRYGADVSSTELAMRLIHEQSVEIVPGDHFGMDGHLRISFGLPEDYLREGLDRISPLLATLR
jgi:aspartate/methionine/tyrosine aminotransferase